METAAALGDALMASVNEQNAALGAMLELDPSFRNLAFPDRDGRTSTAISRRSRNVSGLYVHRIERELFPRLKRISRYFGAAYVDDETREPLATMAVSMSDIHGDFKGVLAAEVALTFMGDLVGGLESGETGRTYVVTRKGALLAPEEVARDFKGETPGAVSKLNALNPLVDVFPRLASEMGKITESGPGKCGRTRKKSARRKTAPVTRMSPSIP